ncbi:hypothetical protein MASR1M90_15300 [Desulfovibrionales bacterium]
MSAPCFLAALARLFMMQTLGPIVRYVQAAPFPHLTSLKISSLAVLAGLETWAILTKTNESGSVWLWLGLTGLLAWGVLLCQADALSRYREFTRVRAILQRYGFAPRVFRVVAASRCQRDAALLAARDAGCQTQAQGLFYQWGYRWYHILPDTIMENPLHFFTPHFLRGTFIPGKAGQKGHAARDQRSLGAPDGKYG